MSWTDYRRRGETLQAVMEHADAKRDGMLPMELPGVREHFTDEVDLVASLVLRWHSRLSGNLERALTSQPMAPEDAVARAWVETANQMPGTRAIVDRCAEHPDDPRMAEALERARAREWSQLALAAGITSNPQDPRAVAAGRRIEMQARSGMTATEAPAGSDRPFGAGRHAAAAPRPDFVQRLRAALVA